MPLTKKGANLATIRLHRYNRDKIINALNDAGVACVSEVV